MINLDFNPFKATTPKQRQALVARLQAAIEASGGENNIRFLTDLSKAPAKNRFKYFFKDPSLNEIALKSASKNRFAEKPDGTWGHVTDLPLVAQTRVDQITAFNINGISIKFTATGATQYSFEIGTSKYQIVINPSGDSSFEVKGRDAKNFRSMNPQDLATVLTYLKSSGFKTRRIAEAYWQQSIKAISAKLSRTNSNNPFGFINQFLPKLTAPAQLIENRLRLN